MFGVDPSAPSELEPISPATDPSASPPPPHLKAIADLDSLIQALGKSLPRAKPWQRRLHDFMADADRRVQVLRLTLSLNRDEAEVNAAIAGLQSSLRAANAFALSGRADMGTKMAVRLAVDLGVKVGAAVLSRDVRTGSVA